MTLTPHRRARSASSMAGALLEEVQLAAPRQRTRASLAVLHKPVEAFRIAFRIRICRPYSLSKIFI